MKRKRISLTAICLVVAVLLWSIPSVVVGFGISHDVAHLFAFTFNLPVVLQAHANPQSLEASADEDSEGFYCLLCGCIGYTTHWLYCYGVSHRDCWLHRGVWCTNWPF